MTCVHRARVKHYAAGLDRARLLASPVIRLIERDDAMMKTIAFATLIASTLIPAAASAQAGLVQQTHEVSYNDLDLTSEAGRDRLDERLRLAVKQVCGSADSRDLREMLQVRRCRREALATSTHGRDLAIANSTHRQGMAMAAVSKLPKLGN